MTKREKSMTNPPDAIPFRIGKELIQKNELEDFYNFPTNIAVLLNENQ